MDKICEGYLRLLYKIFCIPREIKSCRVCDGDLDDKYKARGQGYLCYKCYKYRQNAISIGRYHNLKPYVCTLIDCDRMGERHHPDYDKPKVVEWLCPKHHNEKHRLDKNKLVWYYKDSWGKGSYYAD